MVEATILTFAAHLGSELIDVIAGKEEKCFTVHREPLLSKCDYLKKILVPGVFGKRSYLDFKAEDVGAVSLLVSFIYRGFIPTSEEYVFEIMAKELGTSNAKAQNKGSYFTTFGTRKSGRPAAFSGLNMSDSRSSSPFGKLAAAATLTTPSSPSTFGVPQAPAAPSIFRRSSSTITSEPKSPEHQATVELYQIALLRLCILAEKMSCPAIFNATIRSYNQSEATAGRSTPIKHARLIYGKSAANSTLRDMILDGMYNLGEDGLEKCMAFASEDKNFFRALCTKRLRPKEEIDSVIEALNNGAYDLVEQAPAFGAGIQFGTTTPLKSASSASLFKGTSGTSSSIDAKMEK